MKTCTRCNISKAVENFHWKNKEKGTRLSICKPCKSEVASARWAAGTEKESNYKAKARRVKAAQDFLWSILSNSVCADCGETNPVVFEFDHVRGEKFRDIAKMVSQNYGLSAIREEVEKCDVVCANCHKIRTSTRAGHWRVQRLTAP